MHFFQILQEFGRHFLIHSYGDIFNFGSATAPAHSQRNCTQFEDLSGSYLSAFLLFQLYLIFICLSFQLLHRFTFMISERNCSAVKMFSF